MGFRVHFFKNHLIRIETPFIINWIRMCSSQGYSKPKLNREINIQYCKNTRRYVQKFSSITMINELMNSMDLHKKCRNVEQAQADRI